MQMSDWSLYVVSLFAWRWFLGFRNINFIMSDIVIE